ncbi:hypothetical protein B0H17DRAFT_1105687 [Mycena rosella]|uniref:Uncharacterized protein n=1 Tax=Mycena rosella TaxID=1033263 RepID=A0AAD7FVZ7_MYCRO|nr:hypothetical protein B0H17DRAFT_1105687 [Mycena rosella]
MPLLANSTSSSSSYSCSAAVTARKDTPNGAFADANPYAQALARGPSRNLLARPGLKSSTRYVLSASLDIYCGCCPSNPTGATCRACRNDREFAARCTCTACAALGGLCAALIAAQCTPTTPEYSTVMGDESSAKQRSRRLSQSKITPRPLTQPPIELTTSRYTLGSTPFACLAARPPRAHTRIRVGTRFKASRGSGCRARPPLRILPPLPDTSCTRGSASSVSSRTSAPESRMIST